MPKHSITLNERKSSYGVAYWEATCSCGAFQYSSSIKGEASRIAEEHADEKNYKGRARKK